MEKLNLEAKKKVSRKGLISCSLLRLSVGHMVWHRLRYSGFKYGGVLWDLDIFFLWSTYVLIVKFSQKPQSNLHVFPLFNHSSFVTYLINNRWLLILSRLSNLFNLLQNLKIFWTARLTAQKTSYSCSTMPKCSNDKKSILGFSSPLILIIIVLVWRTSGYEMNIFLLPCSWCSIFAKSLSTTEEVIPLVTTTGLLYPERNL
mgnify:CR=1 FL=1